MARTILTGDQYKAACTAAAGRLRAARVGADDVADAVAAALAAVGLLAPPFDPDPDTCTAMFADPDGDWWQCQDDPDHDGTDHDGGDWGWNENDPNADTIPRRTV
ncbi:hypothetical protein ABT033_37720 [Streptomyces pharetrae]|uniref:hypothetical protein n=1 Tax=Streptomyces pharetrae TaxID=291370 RepID=UPI00334E34CC